MTFEIVLMGAAIHILVWEKIPEWAWFDSLLRRMPSRARWLYEQWHCPYCAGFWIALTLHAATGIWTISELATMPAYWGPSAPVVSWFLDALATATLIYAGIMALKAVGLPAMKAEMMKEEFMQVRFGERGG